MLIRFGIRNDGKTGVADKLMSNWNHIQQQQTATCKKLKIDGWYLRSGSDMAQNDNDFFNPLHVGHLIQQRPVVLKYSGLPPGWKLQTDQNRHEDIWFDKSILNI